jgi:hypothetical protein
MTKDEVLDLALEALESADWYINQLEITLYSDDDAGTHEYRLKVQQAITAIKQARSAPVQELSNLQRHEQNVQKFLGAQPAPVQEPVAWMHWLNGPCRVLMNKDEAMMELDRLNREYPVDSHARKMRPLIFGDTTPPAAQWEQLASLIDENQRLRAELKFNTLPAPHRQWVGLEREIAAAVLDHCYGPSGVSGGMIERTTEVIKAKLKENT